MKRRSNIANPKVAITSQNQNQPYGFFYTAKKSFLFTEYGILRNSDIG